MATLHAIIICLLISLTFPNTHFTLAAPTTNTTTMVSATVKPKRFMAQLLHRDSVIHYPNDTIKNRAERTLNSSVARFIYLFQKASQTPNAQAHLQGDYPSALSFYVIFSIGQPPIPQLAVMDSGSSLTWVNCRTCQQCGTTFDPSKSSTYAIIPCGHTICDYCSVFNECMYMVQYVVGPDSIGILATEKFTFENSDESPTAINDVVFGCGYYNKFIGGEQVPGGVFGLGAERRSWSLVHRFGSRFSYCIGNLSDPEYSYNKLILGEGVVLEGDSTPLQIQRDLYYITLEGISIGDKMLDIDANIFNDAEGNSRVLVDSGTTYTWLVTRAYQVLYDEIEQVSEELLTKHPQDSRWALCYWGKMSADLSGFPVMTLHFADGAELVLDTWSMFEQTDDSIFCLAVRPSELLGNDEQNLSIIGIRAQQYYNVAYDLLAHKLYFQRIDCDLLDD